jgi:hypothetical protein
MKRNTVDRINMDIHANRCCSNSNLEANYFVVERLPSGSEEPAATDTHMVWRLCLNFFNESPIHQQCGARSNVRHSYCAITLGTCQTFVKQFIPSSTEVHDACRPAHPQALVLQQCSLNLKSTHAHKCQKAGSLLGCSARYALNMASVSSAAITFGAGVWQSRRPP